MGQAYANAAVWALHYAGDRVQCCLGNLLCVPDPTISASDLLNRVSPLPLKRFNSFPQEQLLREITES